MLIAALPLPGLYRDGFILPAMGLICFVIGAVLVRWSRVNWCKQQEIPNFGG